MIANPDAGARVRLKRSRSGAELAVQRREEGARRSPPQFPLQAWVYTKDGDTMVIHGLVTFDGMCLLQDFAHRDETTREQVGLLPPRVQQGALVVWSLTLASRVSSPVVVPNEFAKGCWHHVRRLPLACPALADLVRSSGVPIDVQAFRVHPELALRLCSGAIPHLVTGLGHAQAFRLNPFEVARPDPAQTRGDFGSIMVLANTVLGGTGTGRQRMLARAILLALPLAWSMASQARPLHEVVRHVWRLTLSPQAFAVLDQKLQSGELKLPGREVLRSGTIKLDMLVSIFQRNLLATHSSFRMLMVDSSPQKLNLLATIEDRVALPMHLTPQEVLARLKSMEGVEFSRRHLPLSVLGYGFADAVCKGSHVESSIRLEAGENFEKYCDEVAVFSSDQGVDHLCAEQPHSNPDIIRAEVGKIMRGDSEIGSGDGYMFRNCLYYADSLHMLFGALEHVVRQSALYKACEQDLSALSDFLGNEPLRQRAASLLPPVLRPHLMRWTAPKLDFKWEFFHDFLEAAVPLIPILQEHLDVTTLQRGVDAEREVAMLGMPGSRRKAHERGNRFLVFTSNHRAMIRVCRESAHLGGFLHPSNQCLSNHALQEASGSDTRAIACVLLIPMTFRPLQIRPPGQLMVPSAPDAMQPLAKGAGADAHNVNSKILHGLGRSLKSKSMRFYALILRCIARCINRCARWCEGCHCHEQHLSGEDGLKTYEQTSAGCPWKGRRAVSLAAGEVEKWKRDLESCTDPLLNEAYMLVPQGARGLLRQHEEQLKVGPVLSTLA